MIQSMAIGSLIMVLALTATPVHSQQRRMPGPPPDNQPRQGEFAPDQSPGQVSSEEQREEIRKKIQAIRIWRMTDEVKLDSVTSAKLTSLLGPIEQRRRDIQREQFQTMAALRQIIRSDKPDESKIRPLLDRLENNHRAMQELKSAELRGIKDILSVEQQARYMVFQMEFEREMREIVTSARGAGAGRGGMGPGPGGGRMRGNPGPPAGN